MKDNLGYGYITPPQLNHVVVYFSNNGSNEKAARDFFEYFHSKSWKNRRGAPLKNWKVVAWQWIYYK